MYSSKGLSGCGCGCSGGCSTKKAGMAGLGATVSVCTTPMCADAQASVSQMQQIFMALGSPDSFAAQVSSIQAAYDANAPFGSSIISGGLIPFNTACCTLQTIGQQADALAIQMQPGTPALSSGAGSSGFTVPDLSTGLSLVAVIAVAAAYMMYKRKLS